MTSSLSSGEPWLRFVLWFSCPASVELGRKPTAVRKLPPKMIRDLCWNNIQMGRTCTLPQGTCCDGGPWTIGLLWWGDSCPSAGSNIQGILKTPWAVQRAGLPVTLDWIGHPSLSTIGQTSAELLWCCGLDGYSLASSKHESGSDSSSASAVNFLFLARRCIV